MSDPTSQVETTQTETPTAAPEKPEQPAEKTFTQSDVDRLLGERLARVNAKYADYDDLKSAAKRLQEIEDAQKSEQQKAADKIADLEKQIADQAAAVEKANLAALKASVAAAKGVPASRLHGATKEELEADADDYLAEVAAREASAPKRNPTKPPAASLKSGASSPDNTGLSDKALAAQALRRLKAGA